MRPTSALKHDEIKRLRLLVNDAKINMDKTKSFLCKAKIFAKLKIYVLQSIMQAIFVLHRAMEVAIFVFM